MKEETPAPPPGLLLADHFVRLAGYHGYRPAGTRDWLLTYTIGGEGRYRLGSLVQRVGTGDVALLAPGTPHDYATQQSEQPWNFYWAHFLPRPHWARWLFTLPQASPGFSLLSVPDVMLRARLQQVLERVVSESLMLGIFQDDLALNALEEGLILLAQQVGQTEHALDPRIECVLQYLAQHLSDPPSVAELAQLVALSPSRLSHLFQAQVGDSLMSTLLKSRLRQAARLLDVTSQSISEIARATGFRSPFHFSRQFKASYGMNPTMYREQAQKGVLPVPGVKKNY